jgi:hypothetical protein
MEIFSSKRVFDSCSVNRKSKLQNLKWLGLSVIAFMLAVAGAVAEAQQAEKVFRIGFLDNSTAPSMAILREAFCKS